MSCDLDVRWRHNSGTGKISQYFVLERTRRARRVGDGERMGERAGWDGLDYLDRLILLVNYS